MKWNAIITYLLVEKKYKIHSLDEIFPIVSRLGYKKIKSKFIFRIRPSVQAPAPSVQDTCDEMFEICDNAISMLIN